MGNGAPGRDRTCDRRIRNPLLYPLSYGSLGAQRYRSLAGWKLVFAPVEVLSNTGTFRGRRLGWAA